MTSFHIFANDTFWGTWDAEDAEQACQKAADEVGTEGNTDGLTAFEVGSNAQADDQAAAASQ